MEKSSTPSLRHRRLHSDDNDEDDVEDCDQHENDNDDNDCDDHENNAGVVKLSETDQPNSITISVSEKGLRYGAMNENPIDRRTLSLSLSQPSLQFKTGHGKTNTSADTNTSSITAEKPATATTFKDGVKEAATAASAATTSLTESATHAPTVTFPTSTAVSSFSTSYPVIPYVDSSNIDIDAMLQSYELSVRQILGPDTLSRVKFTVVMPRSSRRTASTTPTG